MERIELRKVAASTTATETASRRAERSGGLRLDDDAQLQRLGKRPMLNRTFGFMSSLGFSCTALVSWEGVLVSSVPGLMNGGPAGVIWGFLMSWMGTISVYAVLGELASIAPTASGQYHWVAMMAPKYCSKFLSYTTAWMTVTAWQVLSIANGFLVATLIQGMVVLVRPTYSPTAWQTILIMWATSATAVLINSTTSKVLARFEGFFLILHLAGFFGVLIPLVYFAPHYDSTTVFTTFVNEGGWSTQALSFLVGFPAIANSLSGGDCAVHMSEEIQSAALVVPRALMYTIFINGSLGFSMIIALMFCLGDLPSALAAANTMFYPFLEVFSSAVGSAAGACSMAGVVNALGFASTVSCYATASRLLWSFSRDKGVPFHSYLFRLSRNSLPVNANLATLGMSMLLSLIALGSQTALSALLSLTIASFFTSYLIVCCLLLWRRTTGGIQQQEYESSTSSYLDQRDQDHHLAWGIWRIPEPFGTINNVIAVLWSAFLIFWSFWPQTTPTTLETTNWSILVFGLAVTFSVFWYVVRARHQFKGLHKDA